MVIWDIYRRRIQGRSLRGIFADMDTAPQARQTFSNTGSNPAQSPYQLMFQHRGVCRVYCGGIRATMGSEAIQHLDPPPPPPNTQIHRNSQKMQTMSELISPPPPPVLTQRPSAKGLVLRAPEKLFRTCYCQWKCRRPTAAGVTEKHCTAVTPSTRSPVNPKHVPRSDLNPPKI